MLSLMINVAYEGTSIDHCRTYHIYEWYLRLGFLWSGLENQQINSHIKYIKYHSHGNFVQPINFNKVRLIGDKTCIGY